MPDFLLEIGCEEIPARMIAAASQELHDRVQKLLQREHLASETITTFDTPRRLAILAPGIAAAQADITEQVTGPSVNIAYKDGQPTPAAHSFAKKSGVDVSQLEKITTPKGEYLAAKVTKKGRTATEILAEHLPKEIAAIYWPKNMYWRKTNERFVRPVRWVVAMLDDDALPFEFDGIRAGTTSRGHRILSDAAISIPRAGTAYIDSLRAAKVLGRADREHQIRKALDAATRTIPGARWREDESLIDSVVNLTEFPSVILGSFDPQFLALPEEVLVTVMRDHQKYFALEDSDHKLLPHFLAVLNTDGDPQGLIRHGNERVLRARFNDARFFWQTDQKKSLLERLELLRNVTFQKDLGSYYEKTQRVQRLCSWLSEIIKQSGMAIRPGVVHKAACLAKTDLTTELVKEFTELQGIVGGLYARAQQLDPSLPEATRLAIADAIYDHYKPESTEDSVPRSIEGAVLSIADKADTIAGMFALGLVPSGSKDPFALRRQANAIVKIIAEKNLPLKLGELMADARAGYQGSQAEKRFSSTNYSGAIQSFIQERVNFYLRDICELPYDVVNSVLSVHDLSKQLIDRENWDFSSLGLPTSHRDHRKINFDIDVVNLIKRATAIAERKTMPDFQSILTAFKRTTNILTQALEKGYATGPFVGFADNKDELKLHSEIMKAGEGFSEFLREGRYSQTLDLMVNLRPKIDEFFDKTLIMSDDEIIRKSRLGLLADLYREFRQIADFSEIVTEKS